MTFIVIVCPLVTKYKEEQRLFNCSVFFRQFSNEYNVGADCLSRNPLDDE